MGCKTPISFNLQKYVEKVLFLVTMIKLKDLKAATQLKRDLNTGFFHVNIEKILRTVFFIENFRWLLLIIHCEHLLF